MERLDGRVAIVTGGAGGIGRRIAEALGERGAAVLVADLDGAAAAAVAPTLPNGIDAAVDVADPAAVEAMVARAVERFGGLHILVNSAGIGVQKPFLETPLEDWNRIIAVNLTGTFLCAQAAARAMLPGGWGRIVNIASVAGLRGVPGRSAYGASKGGVIGLTRTLSAELAGRGITVNAIAPGPVDTDLARRMHTPATRAAYESHMPVGRYGTLDEQAAAALYLVSEAAGFVTGTVLEVDGGMTSSGPLFDL